MQRNKELFVVVDKYYWLPASSRDEKEDPDSSDAGARVARRREGEREREAERESTIVMSSSPLSRQLPDGSSRVIMSSM
jgi:hypothetical protein